jgi:succinyl-diaminopimelate desuccinylase
MDAARLCSSLVRIKSENPPGDTSEAVEFLRDYLESLGIRGTVVTGPRGMANLVTPGKDAALLLCGHLDVVPALPEGWSHDPFSGDIADGYVWGRGSTDMKGGCAALIAAYQELADAGTEPSVQFAFVADEESGGEHGIRVLLEKDLLGPKECIIAEPSPPLSPCIGQKGLCRLELCFTGVPGHGSLYPQVGVSAVMEAFSLLEYLRALHARDFPVEEGLKGLVEQSSQVLEETFGIPGVRDVLTRVMFNPGRIEGGEKANIVAQQCRMELDVRIPLGCSTEHLISLIKANAKNATVRVMNASEPSLTDAGAPLVKAICAEVERVYAAPAVPILQWAASDARALRRAGFDVVDYGPGELGLLHGVDERISIEDLNKAVDVYKGVIAVYSP